MNSTRVFVAMALFMFWGLCHPANSDTRHVPGEYSTIQSAIDASADGDIILLADGAYHEPIEIIEKAITMKSLGGPTRCYFEGVPQTAIKVSLVRQGHCLLDGIGFRNNVITNPSYGLVKMEYSNIHLRNCHFVENDLSVDEYIFNLLTVYICDFLISDCTFSNNTGQQYLSRGIKISNSSGRIENTTIDSNICDDSIACLSSDVEVDACRISGNSSRGIYAALSDIRITRSEIFDNLGEGIYCEPYETNSIVIGGQPGMGNDFSKNGLHEVFISSSQDTQYNIQHNTFNDRAHRSTVFPMWQMDLRHCQFLEPGLSGDIYVSPLGNDLNDGLSPDTPLRTLTYVMDNVSVLPEKPPVVHLAPGVYSPDNSGESFPILIHHGVKMIGDTDQSAVINAVGSGDVILAENTRQATLENLKLTGGISGITCQWSSDIQLKNCRITDQSSADRSAVNCYTGANLSCVDCEISGNHRGGVSCTSGSRAQLIRCSVFNNNGPRTGGGMMLEDCEVSVIDCDIYNNTAEYGSGIYLLSADSFISNCRIHHNGSSAAGGGVYAHSDRSFITNCQISDNFAGISGGGIYLFQSRSELSRCRFAQNHAVVRGGGIRITSDAPVIVDCEVVKNTSGEYGAGIACMASRSSITNTLVASNQCADYAGGMSFEGDSTDLVYCTIVDNVAGVCAGLSYMQVSYGSIRNSIVYHNGPDAIQTGFTQTEITYSLIEGGFPGEGNLDKDPLFVDAGMENYRLQHQETGATADSPCINAGDTLALDAELAMIENQLTMAEFSTRQDSIGDSGRVDIGYHYHSAALRIMPAAQIRMIGFFGSGGSVEISARILNPGLESFQKPFASMIRFGEKNYFWPLWGSIFDYRLLDIQPGITTVLLLPEVTIPQTEDDYPEGITYGALLTDDLSDIYGQMGSSKWNYYY